MKPIRRVQRVRPVERGLLLDWDGGLSCRISFLLPDLARVLYLWDGQPVAPRTWMVPAWGAADTPVEGRDRLDESAWPGCTIEQSVDSDRFVMKTEAMTLTVMLSPLALVWALPDGRIFARERRMHPTTVGKTGGARHYFARGEGDRFYGLGDKTGRLDLSGRRLRT